MVEPEIDSYELDWKMKPLRRLAEELYEAACSLDDSTFRQFLYRNERGTDYCSQQYSGLHGIIDSFWKFQLALLWDTLPKRRQVALHFCQEKYELVSRKLTEGFTQKPPVAFLAGGFERLGQASVLLEKPEQVTTSEFAEAAYALAAAYALYCPGDGRDEWAALKAFHQDLYRSFNPEVWQ